MRECAGTDNRLVGGDRHVANLADGLAGTPDFIVIDAGIHVHDVFAHFDRHDHFFQGTVACAFPDTVHRTFYLTGTGVNSGDGVADGQA